MRDPSGAASGGRREQTVELAKAGLATGIAGLFIEAHPGSCTLRWPLCIASSISLNLFAQMKALDDLIKEFDTIPID